MEAPGANGQGDTREECLEDLAQVVKLILEINREEALGSRSWHTLSGTYSCTVMWETGADKWGRTLDASRNILTVIQNQSGVILQSS